MAVCGCSCYISICGTTYQRNPYWTWGTYRLLFSGPHRHNDARRHGPPRRANRKMRRRDGSTIPENSETQGVPFAMKRILSVVFLGLVCLMGCQPPAEKTPDWAPLEKAKPPEGSAVGSQPPKPEPQTAAKPRYTGRRGGRRQAIRHGSRGCDQGRTHRGTSSCSTRPPNAVGWTMPKWRKSSASNTSPRSPSKAPPSPTRSSPESPSTGTSRR